MLWIARNPNSPWNTYFIYLRDLLTEIVYEISQIFTLEIYNTYQKSEFHQKFYAPSNTEKYLKKRDGTRV